LKKRLKAAGSVRIRTAAVRFRNQITDLWAISGKKPPWISLMQLQHDRRPSVLVSHEVALGEEIVGQ
jgi:hypothetical protein